MNIDFQFVNDVLAGKKTAITEEERDHILNAIKESGKDEVWLPIRDYPGYLVSNKGRVWSNKTKKLLKYQTDAHGYFTVGLNNSRTNKLQRPIHYFVVRSFYGITSDIKVHVKHFPDLDYSNNELSNLKCELVREQPVCNESYFENIDSNEKAYWLGFLYADACVSIANKSSNYYKFQFALSAKDIDRLEQFISNIGFIGNLLRASYTNKVGVQDRANINIFNQLFIKNLIKQGCGPNKTNRVKLPCFENDDLTKSFILGYYDGDGNIQHYTNGDGIKKIGGGKITSSSIEFLSDIKTFLNLNSKIDSNTKGNYSNLFIKASIMSELFAVYPYSMKRKRF